MDDIKSVNIKPLDDEIQTLIPSMIHFLPGCNEYEQSWRTLNPEFVAISWDHESLQKVLKATPHLEDLKLGFPDDELLYSTILCYHFGGVVVAKPERCCVRLPALLSALPHTLLATFQSRDNSGFDTDIIVSTAKISALVTLFKYFSQSRSKKSSLKNVFRDFICSSMKASSDGAIVCLDTHVKLLLTSTSKKIKNLDLSGFDLALIEKNFPKSNNNFRLLNPSNLSCPLESWLTSQGKTETKNEHENEKIAILVIDRDSFNMDAPVPDAIQTVLDFQDVNITEDALIIVAHSPSGGIAMDMMLHPQLHMLKAKEIHRSDFVIWKCN